MCIEYGCFTRESSTGVTCIAFPYIGASLGITSDGFFQLEELPRCSVIVGAGYIAVEIAGILSALGSKTSIMIRHDKVKSVLDANLLKILQGGLPWQFSG